MYALKNMNNWNRMPDALKEQVFSHLDRLAAKAHLSEGDRIAYDKAVAWERYRKFLKPDGIVHLKTDSNFMFTYTRCMIEENHLPMDVLTEDLYHSGMADEILSIKTYYEQQWLDRGLNIKYIKFHLPKEGELHEPDVEIELDEYRSYNRSKRSGLQTSK